MYSTQSGGEMLLRAAQNEGLSEIDSSKLTQELVNRCFENIFHWRDNFHIGLLPRTSRDTTNNGSLNLRYHLLKENQLEIREEVAKYRLKEAVDRNLPLKAGTGNGFSIGSKGNYLDLASGSFGYWSIIWRSVQ
jgi:hypothetical protein